MTSSLPVATSVTVSIDCPAERVYEFVADLHKRPKWSFFDTATEAADGVWHVGTSPGEAMLRLVGLNDWGVLDRHVETPTGQIHISKES